MRTRALLWGAVAMWVGVAAQAGPPEAPADSAPAWGTRFLYYLPNRLADLVDIVRARLRLGPGLAAGVRVTDYGAFHAGEYHSVYLGLPGPRHPRLRRRFVGAEELNGIVMAGVDATDNTFQGPEYTPTEVDIGAHLLLAGVDAGFDPLEIADFLAGLVFLDPGDDDYPRKGDEGPRVSSGVSVGRGAGSFLVDPKPAAFDSWAARLDYLQTNVHRRISNPIRATDQFFALRDRERLATPDTRFRFGLYAEMVQRDGLEARLEPDLEMEVELPNLERRLRLFVETAPEDDLPGRDLSEQEDRDLKLGVRKLFRRYSISTDAGVRVRWVPEAFARIAWKPVWWAGLWRFRPQQRLFYETDDGLGEMTSLAIGRWFGASRRNVALSGTSGKWTFNDERYAWEQTFRVAHILTLLDEDARGQGADWRSTAKAVALRYSCFGEETVVTTHRAMVDLRWPMYRQWVFWDVATGVEWANGYDWDEAFRLNVGIDMLFWGTGFE